MRSLRIAATQRVLLVSSDDVVRGELARELLGFGFAVHESNLAVAQSAVRALAPDVVIVWAEDPERSLPLQELLQSSSGTSLLQIGGQSTTLPTAHVVPVHAGQVDLQVLVALVRAAPKNRELATVRETRSARPSAAPSYVWRGEEMREIEERMLQLANSDCAVLILGETGTGKSWLARRLHEQSARKHAPWVPIDCAALRGERVALELFGEQHRPGLLKLAEGGTLLFDEVSDLDAGVQGKVLKIADEHRYRPIGSLEELSADVRILATTHADLLALSSQDRFRSDLYYRISTVTVSLPPLRERRDDILPFAEFMLRSLGKTLSIDDAAAAALVGHSWPGNVRELRNVIERATITARERIRVADLRFDRLSVPPAESFEASRVDSSRVDSSRFDSARADSSRASGMHLKSLEQVEREHIESALEAEGGHVESAAKLLGVPRSTLYQKLKTFGLTARVHEVRARRSSG